MRSTEVVQLPLARQAATCAAMVAVAALAIGCKTARIQLSDTGPTLATTIASDANLQVEAEGFKLYFYEARKPMLDAEVLGGRQVVECFLRGKGGGTHGEYNAAEGLRGICIVRDEDGFTVAEVLRLRSGSMRHTDNSGSWAISGRLSCDAALRYSSTGRDISRAQRTLSFSYPMVQTVTETPGLRSASAAVRLAPEIRDDLKWFSD